MTRVLGIVGSPRRNGNTDVLVSRVLEGAAQAGAKVDTLFLADHAIRECDGCHLCWQGQHCPRADDMAQIFPRIIEANAFVFGTPVYWYGPTGLMKLFIDRFVFFNTPGNRGLIAGKPAAVVVPYEDTDPETVRPVVEFFERCFQYLQIRPGGALTVPGVTARGEVSKKPDVLQAAFDLGCSLVSQVHSTLSDSK